MIGLGLSLTTRAVLGLSFNPATLFAAGEQGILIDPSDLSTLFTDTAGTTPVTAPGQTVALALDKSRGLVLGPELIDRNVGLLGSTYLVRGTSTPVGNGFYQISGNDPVSVSVATVDPLLFFGRTYEVLIEVTAITAGSLAFHLSNGQNTGLVAPPFISITASGTYRRLVTPDVVGRDAITLLGLNSINAGVATVRVSVRELPGNHLAQSTLTFRPAYQATPRRLAFDGGDDRLNSTYAPRVAGSYAVRFNGSTAGRVAIGSQGATDGRAFLGLAADGSIAAGIGAQSTTTIKGTTDVRGTWVTGAVTWNGTTVRLYQDGVEVYSGAQAGAVNTTIPIDLGALNNNSARAAFWTGSIGAAVAIDRVLTPTEIANLHNFWRTIA